MGAKKKAAKAGAAAYAVRKSPYVQRIAEDEELRQNLWSAYESARDAVGRLQNGKHPTKQIFDDKKLQKDVKAAAESFRDASVALREAPEEEEARRPRQAPADRRRRRRPRARRERGPAQEGARRPVRRRGGVRVLRHDRAVDRDAARLRRDGGHHDLIPRESDPFPEGARAAPFVVPGGASGSSLWAVSGRRPGGPIIASMAPVHARAPIARHCADVRLLGADVHVHRAARRPPAPVRQPRLRREHARAARGVGRRRRRSCRGTAASTAAAAPSRRSRRRRSRAPATTCARSSAPRAEDDVVLVRNTTEAINVLAAALPAGTRGAREPASSTTPTCSRGGATTSSCSRSPRRPTRCATPCEQALRGARPPLRHRRADGRVQRHRRGLAARAARGDRAPPRRAARRRRRAARAAPADRHGGARASTSSPSPATSCTPRSAPGRSSARSAGWATRAPLVRAAARSSS